MAIASEEREKKRPNTFQMEEWLENETTNADSLVIGYFLLRIYFVCMLRTWHLIRLIAFHAFDSDVTLTIVNKPNKLTIDEFRRK